MWRETGRIKKVVCLIVPMPSIMPISQDMKLDARCDAMDAAQRAILCMYTVVRCQGGCGREGRGGTAPVSLPYQAVGLDDVC